MGEVRVLSFCVRTSPSSASQRIAALRTQNAEPSVQLDMWQWLGGAESGGGSDRENRGGSDRVGSAECG